MKTIAGTGSQGSADGAGTSATFNYPCGCSVAPGGQYLLVADSNNNKIRKLDLQTSFALLMCQRRSRGTSLDSLTCLDIVSTIVGSGSSSSADGAPLSASINKPWAVVADPSKGVAYVSEKDGNKIRSFVLSFESPLLDI